MVCVDVGSTYTKAMAVDVRRGALIATADHPTTVGSDVLRGVDAAVAATGFPDAPVRACSSAGGGLRLAVVGYEALVTAEAGSRVGLSAGARVVHVATGRITHADVAALRRSRPDIVLLVGGTDGGDEEVLRHNARRLATARLRIPVVLAGNVVVRDDVAALLSERGVPVLPTENVLPRIGELNPGPARATIRDVFLRHVIGGKHLSSDHRFAELVRGPTPDIVLTAVELLADTDAEGPSNVVVVDVGGATTDVYSVLNPDAETEAGPRREVAGTLWRSRTVEADLGVRWSAPGVVAAATAEGLLDPAEAETLTAAAERRADGTAPDDDPTIDRRLAQLAITIALRRHARGERLASPTAPRRGGKDLRPVSLVIGSGGVLRHAAPDAASQLVRAGVTDHAGGYPLPERARYTVDHRYVLAAAGLLAEDHRDAARTLLARAFGDPATNRDDTPDATRRASRSQDD